MLYLHYLVRFDSFMLKSGAEEWIFLKKLSTFKGPTVRKLIGAGEGGGAKYKKNIRSREN